MQRLHVTCLFLLFLTISMLYACPPGYFYKLDEHCVECSMGSFCPGDNRQYDCFPGMVSQPGQISCTICPSNRTNRDRTVCVLPDTPKDAIEIFYESPTIPFTVKDGGYYFLTVYGTGQKTNNTEQVTFITYNKDPYLLSGLNVYASKDTGMPNSFAFSFFAIGENATFFDPKQNSNDAVIYYLNMLTYGSPGVQYAAKVFPYLTTSYRYSSKKFHIAQVDYTFTENQVIFIKDSIPVGTRVLVKFRLLSNTVDNYQLLYSSASNEFYPNPNNADNVVSGRKNDLVLMSVNQSRGGPFVFSLYIKNPAISIGIDFELIY